jgi:acyl-CoA synthetase (AMP-forming)/AMP-acid ligase II
MEFGVAVDSARRECIGHRVKPGSVVEVPSEERLSSLAWIFGIAAVGAVAVPAARPESQESDLQKFVELDWRVSDGRLEWVGAGSATPAARRLLAQLRARKHPGLILSSNARSRPATYVLHDLQGVLSVVPVSTGPSTRTLSLLRLDQMAGLAEAWRALGSGQTLVAPPESNAPRAVLAAIERHKVNALAAPRRVVDLILQSEDLRQHNLNSLKSISCEGSPVPGANRSRSKPPLVNVEFLRRYGIGNLGLLPVHEEADGFAIYTKLTGISWKVAEGELWLKGPSITLGSLSDEPSPVDPNGWLHTGSKVDVRPDGLICERQGTTNRGLLGLEWNPSASPEGEFVARTSGS